MGATPSSFKRMIGKVAVDMTDYANKVEHDIPTLSELMTTGLSAFSQIISGHSRGPHAQDDRREIEQAIEHLEVLKQTLFGVEEHVEGFRVVVATVSRLTTELNRETRSRQGNAKHDRSTG